MTNSLESYENPFLRLNHTELYQLCRSKGYRVHPAQTREELATIIVEGTTQEHINTFDVWRAALIQFLADYWRTLEPQVTCPAKMLKHPTNPEPRPCFGCVDAQVISCVIQSGPQVERLIELRRNYVPLDP